jgi:hypothetical protein
MNICVGAAGATTVSQWYIPSRTVTASATTCNVHLVCPQLPFGIVVQRLRKPPCHVHIVMQPHPAQALVGYEALPDWPGGAFLVS